MAWTLQTDCDVCGCDRCAFETLPNGTVRRLCTDSYLLAMVDGHNECALWSTTECDEDGNMGEPLDDTYSPDDIHDDRWLEFVSDCASFRDCNDTDLSEMDPEQAGHDLWLTRNRHGVGFWDRGLGEAGDRLTRAAHVYGSVDLFPDGAGKVR